MRVHSHFGHFFISGLPPVLTLDKLRACPDSVGWTKQHEDWRSALTNCERADWLLWLAAKLGMDRKIVVLVACDCARTALKFVPAGELRPLRCIETVEAWTRGEATIEQVREARRNAYADAYATAATAAYAADVAYAATAAYAADVAYVATAAYAADVAYVAYVAYAAAGVAAAAYAAYATAAAARKQALKSMVPLVFARISVNDFLDAIARYELRA